MHEFTELEERILALAFTWLPPGPFAYSALERMIGSEVSGSELRFGLWRLKKAGVLAAMQKLTGESLYMIPFQKQMELMPTLFNVSAVETDMSLQKEVIRDIEQQTQDIATDMLMLLDRISKDRPAVTKKGIVSKKVYDNWTSLLGLDDSVASGMLRRKNASSPYPASVSVILDLCLRADLIRMEEGRLAPNKEGISGWLALSDAELNRHIHRLWLQVFCPIDPLARFLAFSIFELQDGTWIDVRRLEEWWMKSTERITGKPVTTETGNWLTELQFLQAAGWLETGRSRAGELLFRIIGKASKMEDHSAQLYVQPDFELMLQANRHYAQHYVLSGFSELNRSDRMRVYRLTAESVQGAYSRGWSADKLIAFLHKYAVNGIPDSVEAGLRSWEKSHEQLLFEPVTAVRFASEQAGAETADLPELRHILTADKRLNATTYIVTPTEEELIKEAMRKLGLLNVPKDRSSGEQAADERLQVLEGIRAEDSPELKERQGGLFHSPFTMEAYKRVDSMNSPSDLYPGLDGVPAMWLQDSRRYHASTLKSILERAIEWRCYVQTVFRENQVLFAPIRLTEASSSVSVEGYCNGEPFSACLSDFGPIRLMLPGIHDDKKFISKMKGIRDMIEKV